MYINHTKGNTLSSVINLKTDLTGKKLSGMINYGNKNYPMSVTAVDEKKGVISINSSDAQYLDYGSGKFSVTAQDGDKYNVVTKGDIVIKQVAGIIQSVITNIPITPTPPSNPQIGDIWIDDSGTQ